VQLAFIEWQIVDLTKVYSKMFLEDLAATIYAKDGLGKIRVEEVAQFLTVLVSCPRSRSEMRLRY
jgi:hypothetical protein